jgi:membrane associated rhomboid family serine protease
MYKNMYSRYVKGDVVAKVIFANVSIYVFLLFIGLFSVLFNVAGIANGVRSLLELPASVDQLVSRPWTLITYMFVHDGPWHLVWNMLALYGFGKLFLNFFSTRQFVGYYLIGGLFGAMLYVLAYNVFPYFGPQIVSSRLVGASAAVTAISVASAVRSPQYRISLFLVGGIKLSTLAVVTVLISILMLSGDNAGGNIAHLGGAFAGWLLAYMLGKGTDAVQLLCRPFDWLASLPGKRHDKKKGKFTYVKGERSADYEYNARKKADEAEVDRILEKIKKGGYASLSDAEKRYLFEASSKK